MKPTVAITLILVGALFIVTPPISDYMHEQSVVRLLEKPGVNNVNLSIPAMSEMYRFGCWATGVVMILISIGQSYNRGRETNVGAGH